MPAPVPSDYDLFRRILEFGRTPEESDTDPATAAVVALLVNYCDVCLRFFGS